MDPWRDSLLFIESLDKYIYLVVEEPRISHHLVPPFLHPKKKRILLMALSRPIQVKSWGLMKIHAFPSVVY